MHVLYLCICTPLMRDFGSSIVLAGLENNLLPTLIAPEVILHQDPAAEVLEIEDNRSCYNQ